MYAAFRLFCKNFNSIFFYENHIFDLCRQSIINGVDRPVSVLINEEVRASFVDHRLDGKHHSGYEQHLGSLWCDIADKRSFVDFQSLWCDIADKRSFVDFQSDSVTADINNNRVAVCLCVGIDRICNISQMSPWFCRCKTKLYTFFPVRFRDRRYQQQQSSRLPVRGY